MRANLWEDKANDEIKVINNHYLNAEELARRYVSWLVSHNG